MKKKIAIIVVVFWMIVIFCLSHQPANASNELSKWIAHILAQNVDLVTSREDFNLTSFNSLIRNYAHFLLYFVLGIIVVTTLKKMGVTGVKGILLSLLICIVFAITDEWHQLYVPGRGTELKDVLTDSAGAITGITVTVGIGWLVRNIRIVSVK